ncbi:MAG TPA: hypothetical protein VHT96_12125 [Clostridia bacterium]|nr:hypothetical protein [Clostridia bacterium]
MVNESGFIVRKSGRREDNYYIDYLGSYKVNDIAKLTGLKPALVTAVYTDHGAVLDEGQEVYYFGSVDAAKSAVGEIFGKVKADHKGKLVNLSEAEIEYIRQALINEGSNTIHLRSRIKDEIFKKLNS